MAKKKLASMEATIDDLRRDHRALIARRMTGPGDSDRAMRRLETEYGLGYWAQWNFQHKRERPPPSKFLGRLRQTIFLALQNDMRRELVQLETHAAKFNASQADVAGLVSEVKERLDETKALVAKLEAAMRAGK